MITMDRDAYWAGVRDGYLGVRGCPYPIPSNKSWAWHSGWIEGEAAKLFEV